jgi:antitoxin (DNA-binding transcriptional repressor) of toxin-antitoxin stability system
MCSLFRKEVLLAKNEDQNMSKMVNLQEAQTHLPQLIASILLDGEIVIVENTKPLARIVPPQSEDNNKPHLKKLSKLKKIEGFFNCDPEDIVHIDWSKEWNK